MVEEKFNKLLAFLYYNSENASSSPHIRYLTFQVYFLGLQARLDDVIVFRENITASWPAKRIIGLIFLFHGSKENISAHTKGII
jgi:hypothetical protein